MARKISKTKQKQKQKQSQKVIVNISPAREKRTYKRSEVTKDGPKSFIPMMPSFNINQPTPSPATDLAKVLGMLLPKLQTESTLGSAIPTPTPIPKPTASSTNIGGLINNKVTPSFINAINSAVKNEPLSEASLRKIYEEPESAFEYVNEDIKGLSRNEKPKFYNSVKNPYYNSETEEAEGIPLVEAEVKPKRKYIKSGKYSKKKKPEDEEE